MAEPTSACSADKACHNVTAEKEAKETLPCCEKDDCSKNEETGTAKKDSPCCNSNRDATATKASSCCAAAEAVASINHIDDSPLCLAVIREDGGDVVLFDASGRPRSFQFKSKGVDIRKLCFNTHASQADDLLTPCFDEEGNHGDPEESCFCGVETPHLHAHLRDPRTCGDQEKSGTTGNKSKLEDNLSFLATQTLHAIDSDNSTVATDVDAAQEVPLYNIDVSERLPNECNSAEIFKHVPAATATNKKTALRHRRRKMHPVQHDDHLDYLVHDTTTGELHLEHACTDCGSEDIHGKFRSVGARKLQGQGSTSGIQLQFFEVAGHGPFNVLEFFHNAFELESERVAAVENILNTANSTKKKSKGDSTKPDFWGIPETEPAAVPQKSKVPASFMAPKVLESNRPGDKKTVRSTIACSRICCPAETPVISAILDKLLGIDMVMVNVPLKQVIVDHDALVISTADIESALNNNHFGASVKRDGAAAAGGATTSVIAAPPTKGRSHFFVQHICCASEIPAINKIVEPIKGVSAVSINVTTKTVYVDHDTGFVVAKDICDALNKQGFGAEIRHDFATAAASTRSMFVQSMLTFEHGDPDTEALTAFLRTFDASQLESFVVDVPARTIAIVHNPLGLSAQLIADQLAEPTGIKAIVLSDGASNLKVWDIPAMDESSTDGMEEDEPMTYPSPAVILAGVFWIVSMLSFVGGNWDYLKYVGLLSVCFGLPSIAIKALRTLRRYQFDTNCLMFFASVGALALGEFAEAAAVVFLFALSEWLEVRATSRARRALSAIVHLRPEKANLVHPVSHELIVVPASTVPVGALVSVKTGDKIPCDGVVVEGRSTVDESSLTGESRPIRKGPEDKVSGGTVNSGMTQLMVRTTSTSENSAVSRLIRLVEEAQANRSETEKLVDEFAKIYTPIVVLAALLMCSIPWAFGSDTGKEWTTNGLVLIVVACPCALIISTPVSYVAGLAATAQKGVLIKGGANLEALGMVKSICFDKTGTLTNGEFALLHMDVFGGKLSRKEVFQYLSLMEERAAHPVAQAILTGARNEGVAIPKAMKLQKHTIIVGEGVSGVINGLEVHIGNDRMFARLELLDKLQDSERMVADSWKLVGGTVGYMSVEGLGIVCAFCAADGVRPESASVVKSFKKLGIELTMLTGDNQDAALAIGGLVGLVGDEIKAKLLPADKLEYVTSLCSDHKKRSILFNPCSSKKYVIMCGDGVNDAPALAAADVGVAMGAGAALAMETADVTLLDSNLEKLEYSIHMGRRVISKIKQNVVFSIGVKVVVLGFALAGQTNLWAAIATDVGAMILVTLNAMLLLPPRQRSSDIATLKGDIEHANKARAVVGRDSSGTTDSDDEVLSSSRAATLAKTPACCEKSSGCCDIESSKDEMLSHESGHACALNDSQSEHDPSHHNVRSDHEHSHAHEGGSNDFAHQAQAHNETNAAYVGGCCLRNEETTVAAHADAKMTEMLQ